MEKTPPMDERKIHEPNDPKEDICLILESSGTTGQSVYCQNPLDS